MLVDFMRGAISTMTAAAIVTMPLITIVAIVARVRHRRIRGLLGGGVLALGLVLGYALLVTEAAPAIRTATILLTIGLVLGLSAAGRTGSAGLLLIAATGPWFLYFWAALVDLIGDPRARDPWRFILPLFVALLSLSVGIALVKTHRDRERRQPRPIRPPEVQPRRWDAASLAALGPTVRNLNAAGLASVAVLVVGVQTSAFVGHDLGILQTIAVVVIGSLLTGLASTLAWVIAWPPRDRRAFEAFAWIGEHDLERGAGIIETKPTFSNLKRYVQNTEERVEDRWLRVEMLAALGRIDEAHAIAERLPDHTPVARVERAALLGYTSWLAGGGAQVEELRAAVAEVEPRDGDDRLRAEVSLAMAEVRALIADGDPDPAAPLRAVRDRIGTRADRVMLLAARRQVEGFLKLAAIGVITVTLIARALPT